MKFRTLLALGLVGCLFSRCGAEKDVVPDQDAAILRYLNGKKIENFVKQDGVYRFIPNDNRPSYNTDPIAENGDSIYFMFEQYMLVSSVSPDSIYTKSGSNTLVYTNKEKIIKKNTILNGQFWSLDTMRVRLGATQLIEGLGRGLPGCRQGDSVVMFITSDLSYANKEVGIVPPNTPLMMILNITKVKK